MPLLIRHTALASIATAALDIFMLLQL